MHQGALPGNPAKLGEALVKIAKMENTPKVFVVGSDALALIAPAVESRRQEMRRHEKLSRSTDLVVLANVR